MFVFRKGRCSAFAVVKVFLLMVVAVQAQAYEKGDVVFRLGYASVDLRENVDPVIVDDQLNLGGLGIESIESPALTIGVQLSKRWGLEVLLPLLALDMEVGGNGGALTDLAMGTAEARPAYVLLQYYPFEANWGRPYFGLGVNYIDLSNSRINNAAAVALGIDSIESLEVENTYGLVLQAGIDIPVTERLSLNFSTSYMDVNTEASTTFYVDGQLHSGKTRMDIKKQPNISVVGISYRW